MFRASRISGALGLTLAAAASLGAQAAPAATKSDAKATIAQYMSPPSPLEFAVAKKTDRIAWVTYERGMRNVYTAAAPDFKAVRVTKFPDDDGVDVGGVQLSNDG